MIHNPNNTSYSSLSCVLFFTASSDENVQNRSHTISNSPTTSIELNRHGSDSTGSSSSSPYCQNHEDVKQEILSGMYTCLFYILFISQSHVFNRFCMCLNLGNKLLRVNITRIDSTGLGSEQKRKSEWSSEYEETLSNTMVEDNHENKAGIKPLHFIRGWYGSILTYRFILEWSRSRLFTQK